MARSPDSKRSPIACRPLVLYPRRPNDETDSIRHMTTRHMIRHRVPILLAAATLLGASGPARANCLPTLGTNGCFRWDYLWIQPL